MEKEKPERPKPPKPPPLWADPQALHNWEDEMVRYADSLRWEKKPIDLNSGHDTLLPLTDKDYDDLERYAG